MPDAKRIEDEALLAVSTGDWLGAADLFGRLEELAPRVATWPLRRGECLRRAGRRLDAVAALTRAANTYLQSGDADEAARLCEEILRLDPANAPIAALLDRLRAQGSTTPDEATWPVLPQAWNPPAATRAATRQSGRFPMSALMLLAEDPFFGGEPDGSHLRDEPPSTVPSPPQSSALPARPRVVLPVTPFFSALSAEQLRLVNARARLVSLSPGEVVYAAGEPSDAVFVVASGAIAVLVPQQVARLERGEVFGEEAVVLPGHTRMATLRAAEPCQLLVLDRGLVETLMAEVPKLVAILTEGLCERLVVILSRTSPMLASLPEPDRMAALGRFGIFQIDKGGRICERGGERPGLFILLAGAASAAFDDTLIERLQPGDVFGELALVTDSAVDVTATARERCFVLHLPQADFGFVRKTWPGLVAYLEVLAAKRLARLEQAVLDDAPVSQSVPLPPRVLVIHLELATRQSYERALANAGFLVDATGEAATVDRLIADRRYDVVLYNLDPAAHAGADLLLGIRRRDLDVPIILTTRRGTLDASSAAANYSVVRGFREPVDLDELVRAATRAVHFHRLTRLRREAMTRLNSSGEWMGDRSGLELHFEAALERLHMAFQPIVSAVDNTIFAYEALVRSGEELLHTPLALLRAAERLSRVHDVGRIVRDLVGATLGSLDDPPVVFVNVHSHDLLDPQLLDADSAIAAFASRVVLEVTERTPLDELFDLGSRVRGLRALGYRFALDNLGAGHAGVGSLAQLEPEVCKLDLSLIHAVDQDPVKWDLVRALLAVCRDMNILTICEGVETLSERDVLLQLGADLMQGYLFAKPGPAFPAVSFATLGRAS